MRLGALEQPAQRADDEERAGGRGEAGALVLQVGDTAAGFDAKDVGPAVVGVGTEMQPQPIWDCPEGTAAGQLDEGLAGLARLAWTGAKPGAGLPRRARCARRSLRLLAEPSAHQIIQRFMSTDELAHR